jgi:N-acetylglutamate synthase/N-acetylornithine aminotransferase
VLGTLAKQAGPGEWMNAAKAIMTTDTFLKEGRRSRRRAALPDHLTCRSIKASCR